MHLKVSEYDKEIIHSHTALSPNVASVYIWARCITLQQYSKAK